MTENDFWSEPTHTGDDGPVVFGLVKRKRGTPWYPMTFQAVFWMTVYWLRNLRPLPCRKLGYRCDWIYPDGFVPEGGCPLHD